MRPSLPLALAVLLAAIVAAPVAAVAPGGAAEETVTGVLEAVQVELADDADRVIYTVRDGHRVTHVKFESGDPAALAGAIVTVHGNRKGGALNVRSAAPG